MTKAMHRSSMLWLLAWAVIVLAASCKPSASSDIIPADDMEDLLYDYHLADAMARQAKGNYEQNLIAYHAAVLKKHGVTVADFDSSMVYYMRHATQLHDMYENIAERLGKDAQAMGSSVSVNGENGDYNTASGDTIDLWKGPQSLVLIPNMPYNLYSFHFKPDAKAQKGDDYVLSAHSNFIFQDGMRDGIVTLALVYSNDSVASRVMHVSSSMDQQVVLTDGDSVGVKEIRGYFMLKKNNQQNSSSTTLQLAAFDRIHLLRCHRKVVKPAGQPAAEQNADSSKRPSARVRDSLTTASGNPTAPSSRPGVRQANPHDNEAPVPPRTLLPRDNIKLMKESNVKPFKTK